MLQIALPDGGPIISYYKIDGDGTLVIPAFAEPPMKLNIAEGKWEPSDDGTSEGHFDPLSQDQLVREFLYHNVWEHVKIYNFADDLKDTVLIGLLGLKRESVYGTNEQKNEPTHLRWEDMPIPTDIAADPKRLARQLKRTGFLTGRDCLTWIGTKVFRRMYAPVWVNAAIKRAQAENPHLAIFGDVRFPDEVEGVQATGGKVIRFTRCPHPEDRDESETALDKENFDWSKFDAVIDNENQTHLETKVAVMDKLQEWGIGMPEENASA